MRPTKAQIVALRRRDPVLGAAIPRLPPFPEIPVKSFRGPHFHGLARSIIYQQLATKAAATLPTWRTFIVAFLLVVVSAPLLDRLPRDHI